jgi:hypothetical protein
MGYIQGDGRSQGTLFPVVLDDLMPANHICRVIDAFVDRLAMKELGFEASSLLESFVTASERLLPRSRRAGAGRGAG